MQMSGFLAKCETELGVPELSWEAYLQPKPPLFTITTVLAWLLMLAAAGYATCVGLSMSGFSYCMASK